MRHLDSLHLLPAKAGGGEGEHLFSRGKFPCQTEHLSDFSIWYKQDSRTETKQNKTKCQKFKGWRVENSHMGK